MVEVCAEAGRRPAHSARDPATSCNERKLQHINRRVVTDSPGAILCNPAGLAVWFGFQDIGYGTPAGTSHPARGCHPFPCLPSADVS